MGGNSNAMGPIIGNLMQKQQQPTQQPGPGANYQAPPANIYRQQQGPSYTSPFVQQQMQMQRGLGQQQYVSPLQSMLSRILAGHNPQQFNQQAMPPQGMPPQGYGQMYRPNMDQVHQNLYRVAPPVMPPAPTPAQEPVAVQDLGAAAGGGGD